MLLKLTTLLNRNSASSANPEARRARSSMSRKEKVASRLFVGHRDLSAPLLRSIFEPFGPVRSVDVLNSCAFVQFERSIDAKAAKDSLQGTRRDGIEGPMRIENSRDNNGGSGKRSGGKRCFQCGRGGHFARSVCLACNNYLSGASSDAACLKM